MNDPTKGAFGSAASIELSHELLSALHDPIPRLPCLEDPRFVTRRLGDATPAPVDVFVFRDVFEELCYRAAYDPSEASFSLLTGGWYVGPLGPYVEIEGFRDSVHVDDVPGLLDYLAEHPELFNLELSPRRTQQPRRLGCSLALPGSDAHLSPEVILLCNTYFNSPYHTTLLIDARDDQFAFYVRDDQGAFCNAPFWLIDDADAPHGASPIQAAEGGALKPRPDDDEESAENDRDL